VELDTAIIRHSRSGSLTMHINKVSHVKTINLVARELGESEDWLYDVAADMETEDGLIRVYGIGEDSVMAFTDFGIESLIELVKIQKNDPTLLKLRWDGAK
jgi:hypothetical protein